MATTEADIKKVIEENEVEFVDVRFCDLPGVQQHFVIPVSEFLDTAFTDGMAFDGSSIKGFQAINESDMKLIPDLESTYIDPFREHVTLIVVFSVVD
ncbi:MAG: glutamine synthetase, partial [Candidatus Ancillula sp.]|nr:glutamine synthetase [Candidatus Ancillula sp.]